MLDLKKVIEQLIFNCTIDDIKLDSIGNIVFNETYTANIFKSTQYPIHYMFDDKLIYPQNDPGIQYNFATKKLDIDNINLNLYNSFSRIKLHELSIKKSNVDNILKLCLTGK